MVTFHTLGESKNRVAGSTPEPELRIANEKKIVQTCHRIVVPTKRESDSLVRFYGAPEEKIGIVPCGVNLELFRPEKKRLARQRLEFNPDDILLLYVGRFDALKGLDILLTAMTCLKSSDRFRLVIVGGDGEDHHAHQSLIEKTRELGISERCVFTGPIEHQYLPSFYNSADVLVIPSRYESFGLVGLEALACGRPVVSTPVGAMDNLLRDVRAVRMVSNSSPESLAGEIKSLIADPSLPSSAEIRASVTGYSWSRVADRILMEYQEAIDRHASENDSLTRARASG